MRSRHVSGYSIPAAVGMASQAAAPHWHSGQFNHEALLTSSNRPNAFKFALVPTPERQRSRLPTPSRGCTWLHATSTSTGALGGRCHGGNLNVADIDEPQCQCPGQCLLEHMSRSSCTLPVPGPGPGLATRPGWRCPGAPGLLAIAF
jgi:hypothetical protein